MKPRLPHWNPNNAAGAEASASHHMLGSSAARPAPLPATQGLYSTLSYRRSDSNCMAIA